MRIIDFHTHIYPQKIAKKATQSIRDFYDLKGSSMCGTPEQLLERGKVAGIEHFVVLPVAISPAHVRHINEFVAAEVEKNPEFTGFGTVHAAMDNIEQEIEYIKSLGLKGIKIHPDTQGFNIDDERLFPMYDMICGKMPIMLHTGDPRYDYSHPRRLRKVLDMFPGLTAVAAHFGGWSVFDEAYEALHDKDCYMDISSSLRFMPEGKAEEYISLYGAERLLFGSDFPLWDPVEELKLFMKLKISDEQREKICFKNALRLLGREVF